METRKLLKVILTKARFEAESFSFHGFHVGRASDLLKMGISVETIKKLGHWKSNIVYEYL